MPRVGFECMVPASERTKTVYVLDRSATVAGYSNCYSTLNVGRQSTKSALGTVLKNGHGSPQRENTVSISFGVFFF
jgi:hypothetical protein